jgi:hypothetical protein
MLRGDVDLFVGCRRLAGLAHHVVADWTSDRDFVVFGAVASETDNYPIGAARMRWSLSALAREDAKIAEYEAAIREQVLEACRSVMTRFTSHGSGGPDV